MSQKKNCLERNFLSICFIFSEEEVHWGYPSDNEEWGKVSEICATGVEQSPIDLPSFYMAATQSAIETNWNSAPITMTDTGHSLKWVIHLFVIFKIVLKLCFSNQNETFNLTGKMVYFSAQKASHDILLK